MHIRIDISSTIWRTLGCVTGYNFTSHNSGTYTVNDGWGNVGININSSYTDGGVDIG